MSNNKQRATAGMITAFKIKHAEPGQWLTEKWPRGEGSFQVRILGDGSHYYYRYTDGTGKQQRIALPRINEKGLPITLAEARRDAKSLARRYTQGHKNIRETIAHEISERERIQKQQALEEQKLQQLNDSTFGVMLEAYCDYLELQGKVSHKAVRQSIQRHIEKAFPQLWNTPAADIQTTDLTPVLTRLVNADHLREANKVRAYMRAAYSAACGAPVNAQAPESLQRLGISSNPARDLGVIAGANKTRDDYLTLDELRALWRRIKDGNNAPTLIVKLYLLTGGQRFRQLARTTVSDIVDDCLILMDSKGRRANARKHSVPLLPEAIKTIRDISPHRAGPYLVSLTQGETPADHGNATHHLKKIAQDMVDAGEARKVFTFGVLRSTVETRLAAIGVSSDIRAQLQSHGLGGVQTRHYDRHDYQEQKLDALKKLQELMLGG